MAQPRSKYETQSAAPTQRRSRYETATPASAPSMRDAPKVKSERSLLGAFGEAFPTIPSSAVAYGKGFVEAVTNPVQTAQSMFDIAAGSAELGLKKVLPKQAYDFYKKFDADPASAERAMETARQFGGVYKQRYGSYEALKRTIATDPVGAIADLSMLFTGGAGLARGTAKVTTRVAPSASVTATRAADVLSKAAAYTDPLNILAKPVSVAGSVIKKAPVAVRNFAAPKSTALLQTAEGRGPELVQKLRSPDIELVPGSKPTAAEVASDLTRTQFSALGESARKVEPTLYYQRDLANEAARLSAVQSVGKTPADIAKAETARTAATTPLYKAAEAQVFRADPKLMKLAEDPYIKLALPDAMRLSNSQGVSFANNPTRYIHNVKISLDKMLTKTGETALARGERAQVTAVKNQLVDWLETKAPDYKAARTTFADMSKPINQMQVGQYLEGKLATPLDVGERANVFAGALKDAPGTIKRATTNEARFKALTDILTSAQVKIVNSIRDDLARAAKTKRQAKLGAEAAPKATDLASTAQRALQAPNMLNTAVMIAQNIMSRLRGKIDSNLAIQLALEMLDPKAAANALEKAMRGEALATKIGRVGAAPYQAAGGALRAPATLAAERTANAMANAQTYNDTYYDDYDNYSPR